MNLPKIFLSVTVFLFLSIGVLALVKKKADKHDIPQEEVKQETKLQEVDLQLFSAGEKVANMPIKKEIAQTELPATIQEESETSQKPLVIEHDEEQETLETLFRKGSDCPIIETIRYKSKVAWKPKRSAWLIDYSHHYKTPLDFIYRSLSGRLDYKPVTVSENDQFNVFRNDLNFRFHLVVSFSSLKMRLYYVIPGERRVVFLKSYPVCLGRKEGDHTSGSLTPTGIYSLGSRVGVFRPRMMGMYKGKKVELISVFGTHWIPFDKEIEGCSEPAKGLGIHGTPWKRNSNSKDLEEDDSSLGKFESDGCIRLSKKDIEELFAIVSARTAYVEIVPDFQQSKLLRGEI
jgi:hypothetical protein